jgi:hypothetical protein
MEIILLSGILIDIIILVLIAKKLQGGLKFLLYTLSGFWFLSFFLRPVIFIYSRDNNIDSKIYDFRIGQSSSNFTSVLLPIVVGCFFFCWPLILHAIRTNKKSKQSESKNFSEDFNWLIFYGISVGFLSMLLEETSFRNPLSKSLTTLLPIAFSAFLWSSKELMFSYSRKIAITIFGTLGILVLSINSNNSKGVLLMPALIYISRLEIWRQQGKLATKSIIGVFLPLILIPIFSLLQVNKLGEASFNSAARNSELLPWFLSPFVILVDRFDQFSRVADAIFVGPSPLGSFNSWIAYLVNGLVWNPNSGRTELSFGQEWNQLVTSQSIPGSRLSSVALSQGMIAEGLIWSGMTSLIIECLIFALIFIWAGRLMDAQPINRIFAFGLIANSTIFEMGTVQFSSALSSTVKIFLFLIVSNKLRMLLQRMNN